MGTRSHIADAENVTAALVETADMPELFYGGDTPPARRALVLTDHGTGERFAVVGDTGQLAALTCGMHGHAARPGEVTLSDAQWERIAALGDYTDYTANSVGDVTRVLVDAMNALNVRSGAALACPALEDIGIWDASDETGRAVIVTVRVSPDLRLATHPLRMWEFQTSGPGPDDARRVLGRLLDHRNRLLRELAEAAAGRPHDDGDGEHGVHGQAASPAAAALRGLRWEGAGYRFPDAGACRAINEEAYFLPAAGPDELPCLIVGGVRVFAYLDPQTGAVCVSVDLDGTQLELVRPDGTLPLRVDVARAPVFDESNQARVEGRVLDPTRR